MTAPSLETEYANPGPLQVRIATHQNYSERPDDPTTAVLGPLQLTGTEDLTDIGCGDARFLAQLRVSGHTGRLVGVDTSPAKVAADAITAVTGVLGDAQKLPFTNGEFDTCAARHMPYHVPGLCSRAARVPAHHTPGRHRCRGRNHTQTCHRTHQLVATHAHRHGLTPTSGMINHDVNSDTLLDMMQDVFGNVKIETYSNALIFEQPGPLIVFAESLFSFCGITRAHPRRTEVLADVATEIERWFSEHPGEPWCDPKGYTVATGNVRA